MRRAPSTSAMTLAASVFPTPASPSMNRGFSSFRARKIEVARPRSPMYLRSRRRCSTSSMVLGAPSVTRKGYEVDPHELRGLRLESVGMPFKARRDCRATPVSLTRLLDRSLGQHPRQVLLVLGARAQVT